MSLVAREKVLCTAKTRTTGERENGLSRSYDGHLDVKRAVPGSARIGTNPEQLFATAWSACFESAIALAASKSTIALPAAPVIDAEVELFLADSGSALRARFKISLPSIARDVAQSLVAEAQENCPYTKATRQHRRRDHARVTGTSVEVNREGAFYVRPS
jgi:osmotically inducible protein OsmC